MKKFFSIVSAVVLLAGGAFGEGSGGDGKAASEPMKLAAAKTRMKCSVCNGKGSLKIRPPDVGQYAGRIEDRSHWDIKLDPCPVCGRGHGWRTVWDLTQPEPSTEPPCMKCGWSGLDPSPCRKCLGSGVIKCPRRDCQDGWIIMKVQSSGRRSAKRPPDVKQCPECKGVGKVECPTCRGMRAELCKKCHGAGRKLK